MTYSYSNRVGSVKLLGLARLLGIWRASVYKLVFRELLIFSILYLLGSSVYRFGLTTDSQKRVFEKIVVYCGTFESIMPVTFVLGFYVSVIVQRWWSQFMHIPWPDRIMSYISALVPGKDPNSLMMRRTLIRYLILAEVLLLMTVSSPVKKRFPTVESLVDQGLMTKAELEIFNSDSVPHISSKYWVPTHWFTLLLSQAKREKKISDSYSLCVLLDELSKYKDNLGTVFSYDWISLPLVYTQVATVAVYVFYFNTMLSRQYINYERVRQEFGPEISAKYSIDLYFPVDTVLQLFFYLGWLKVAEQMINPFGEDDDDFECNWIIDRNLKVGLYAVSGGEQPPMEQDAWWDKSNPQMWYTEASEKFAMSEGWFGSTANLDLQQLQPWANNAPVYMPHIPEDGELDSEADIEAESGSNFTSTYTVHTGLGHQTARRDSKQRRLPPLHMPVDTLRAAKEILVSKSKRRRSRTTTGGSGTQSPIISRSLPSSQFFHDFTPHSHPAPDRRAAADGASPSGGGGSTGASLPSADCVREFGHLTDIAEQAGPNSSASTDVASCSHASNVGDGDGKGDGDAASVGFDTGAAAAAAAAAAGGEGGGGQEEIQELLIDETRDNAPLIDNDFNTSYHQQQQQHDSESFPMNGEGEGNGEDEDNGDSQEKSVSFNPQIERLEYDENYPLLQQGEDGMGQRSHELTEGEGEGEANSAAKAKARDEGDASGQS